MAAKLSLEDLPADVREAIARGERVCVYDDGQVAATVVPEDKPKGDGRELWRALAELPRLDDDFEKDVEGAFAPVLGDPWER